MRDSWLSSVAKSVRILVFSQRLGSHDIKKRASPSGDLPALAMINAAVCDCITALSSRSRSKTSLKYAFTTNGTIRSHPPALQSHVDRVSTRDRHVKESSNVVVAPGSVTATSSLATRRDAFCSK